MGNFTTAYTALKLGRRVCGYEINRSAYEYHMPQLQEIEFGCDLKVTPADQLRTSIAVTSHTATDNHRRSP